MREDIYPLTFHPAYRSYIWGGRDLEALGRALPPGVIAESWEISGLPASPTTVAQGPLAGRPLDGLVAELGEALVGRRSATALAAGRFPLLVKLLDAHDRLSVQVHPPDDYAQAHEHEPWGKSEMWYILRAAPDAQVILGLCPGVTPDAFRQSLDAGQVERWLHYLPVRAGDAVQVEAGAVHAMLRGIVAVEIQQASDVTYRVYDWDRTDAAGKPRPLHVDRAMDVIRFDVIEPGAYAPRLLEQWAGVRREIISQTHAFAVERVELGVDAGVDGDLTGDTFEIWGCLDGDCTIEWAGGNLPLAAVHFVLLPAALGRYRISAGASATLLRAWC